MLERLSSKISTRIVAVSEAQMHDLTQVYKVAPREKFVTLIYGFDLKPLTEPPPQGKIDAFIDQHRLPRDKKRIGIIGRLVPIKNHELFLQAAQVIAEKRNDVHFVIAGDGQLRTDLEALTRELGLEHCVTFTGWVRDVKTAMYSLDVMALTSKNEGTPVSIIEGMAAGLPVVSTDVGGVTDILNHGELGYIVPPSDSQALAKSLLLILNGDLPDARRAQTVALKRFDATYRAQELSDLYRNLLRASCGLPPR